MPIVTVTEYGNVPLDQNGVATAVFTSALASTGYAPTATSQAHTVGGDGRDKRLVRISGDVNIHIKIGSAATTSDPFLHAGGEYLIFVSRGQTVNFRTA